MFKSASWINRFEIRPGRWIYEPSEESRINGEKLIRQLAVLWQSPDFYFHLKNGGHVQAVIVHLPNKYFAKLDLKDFFGSVGRSRITRILKEFYPPETARKLAKMSTIPHVGDGEHSHSLPNGFVQSPMLASICLSKSYLGSKLAEYRKSRDICITLYMDDILISSNSEEMLVRCFEDLNDSAKKSKFNVNLDKSHAPRLQTTIFNIEVSQNRMNLTEKRFRELHAVYEKSQNKHQRHGIGAYVGTINKAQAFKLDIPIVMTP